MTGRGLFAYGTLCADEIVDALLGRSVEWSPAFLWGYRMGRVRSQAYPGIVPGRGEDRVEGRAYAALTHDDWRILDAYEGDEYERRSVTVDVVRGTGAISGEPGPGHTTHLDVYVFRECAAGPLTGQWRLEEFRRDHLADYVSFCRTFRRTMRD